MWVPAFAKRLGKRRPQSTGTLPAEALPRQTPLSLAHHTSSSQSPSKSPICCIPWTNSGRENKRCAFNKVLLAFHEGMPWFSERRPDSMEPPRKKQIRGNVQSSKTSPAFFPARKNLPKEDGLDFSLDTMCVPPHRTSQEATN